MKCCCYDLITVNMNVEEACRFCKDIYDSEIWIYMKCEKIEELWQNDELRHDSLQMNLCSW